VANLNGGGETATDASREAFRWLPRSLCGDSSDAGACPLLLACRAACCTPWFNAPDWTDLNSEACRRLNLHLCQPVRAIWNPPQNPGQRHFAVLPSRPWPARTCQVYELAKDVRPRYSVHVMPGRRRLLDQPAASWRVQALLHTPSRSARPGSRDSAAARGQPGWTAGKHCKSGSGVRAFVTIAGSALAGLGVALAPQQLVAERYWPPAASCAWGLWSRPLGIC